MEHTERSQSGGARRINKSIADRLRTWMFERGREALAQLPLQERATSPLLPAFARLLEKQGRCEEALGLLEEALPALCSSRGPHEERALSCRHLLAVVLKRLRRLAEAEEQCRAVLEGRRSVLGQQHKDTLDSMFHLSIILKELGGGREAEAEQLCREALEGQSQLFGPGSKESSKSGSLLALLLERRGDLEGAEALLLAAFNAQVQLLGREDDDTLITTNNLARLRSLKGRHEEALQAYAEVLLTQRKAHGDGHAHTLITLNLLAKEHMACASAMQRRREEEGQSAAEERRMAHLLAAEKLLREAAHALRSKHEGALAASPSHADSRELRERLSSLKSVLEEQAKSKAAEALGLEVELLSLQGAAARAR